MGIYSKYDLSEALSEALFIVDPAKTCCVENNMYDEYDSSADMIVTEFNNKFPNIISTKFEEDYTKLDDEIKVELMDIICKHLKDFYLVDRDDVNTSFLFKIFKTIMLNVNIV